MYHFNGYFQVNLSMLVYMPLGFSVTTCEPVQTEVFTLYCLPTMFLLNVLLHLAEIITLVVATVFSLDNKS